MRVKSKDWINKMAILVLGAAVYAIGYRFFIEPSHLVLGGATGLATLLNYLFFVPVGIGFLIVNLPLLVLGWILHGFYSVVRSAFGIIVSALALDLFAVSPVLLMPPALGAALGGACSAVGIALLLWEDFTTGGTELAAILIHERFSRLAVGKAVLLIDSAIVLFSVFLMERTEMLVYSVILNLSFAVTLDGLLDLKPLKNGE